MTAESSTACKNRLTALLLLAAACFSLTPAIPASAEECVWRQPTFSYVAEDQDLAQVLAAFGATEGLSVVVSPEVQGTVSGSFMEVTPEDFLESLSAAHGLVWYRDGAGLFVYASHEVDSAFMTLEFLTPADAIELVKTLGIYADRFPLRSVENPPMIHVVGPPRYLQNISAVIKAAEDQLSRREVRQEEVRLFELKHAWADDIRLPLREGEVRVPGVATILRRLMVISGQTTSEPREILSGAEVQGAGGGPVPLVKRLPGLINEPAETSALETAPAAAPQEYKYGTPTHMQSQLASDIRPSIEADMRRNAVLVRDSGARIKLYEDLIRQLDVPVRLVEIQASILDVDADLSFEWGLDASLSFQDEHNEGNVNILTPPGPITRDTLGNAGGIDASWLLLNDHLRFLSVVRALEGKGQARILSRPSLITFANLEAELRDDQTYNVRITGERVADLVSVTAGVQLRVTANVIDPPAGQEDAPPGIQLLVHIEDGSFESSSVDGLPVVRTSALNTQAVIGHGQSLLVGGYIKDAAETNLRGVPFLSKIPVVGSLFKSTGRSHQLMQRMFLLTPTMVELDAAMGLDPLESAKQLKAEEHLFNLLEQQAKIKGVGNKSLPHKDLHPEQDKSVKKKARENRAQKQDTPAIVPGEDLPKPRADANTPCGRNFSFRKPSKVS